MNPRPRLFGSFLDAQTSLESCTHSGKLPVQVQLLSSYYILVSNIAWRTLDTLSDQYCQLLHKGMSAFSMGGRWKRAKKRKRDINCKAITENVKTQSKYKGK